MGDWQKKIVCANHRLIVAEIVKFNRVSQALLHVIYEAQTRNRPPTSDLLCSLATRYQLGLDFQVSTVTEVKRTLPVAVAPPRWRQTCMSGISARRPTQTNDGCPKGRMVGDGYVVAGVVGDDGRPGSRTADRCLS